MVSWKTGLAAILALAFAGGTGLGAAQAFTKLERPAVSSSVEQIAAKKMHKKKRHKMMANKHKKHKKWKSCGVYKYHGMGTCMDARKKK
jgi:hypothetical protein